MVSSSPPAKMIASKRILLFFNLQSRKIFISIINSFLVPLFGWVLCGWQFLMSILLMVIDICLIFCFSCESNIFYKLGSLPLFFFWFCFICMMQEIAYTSKYWCMCLILKALSFAVYPCNWCLEHWMHICRTAH